MTIRVYIADTLVGLPIIHYTLQLIATNKRVEFQYTQYTSEAHLCIGDNSNPSIPLCLPFYQFLAAQDFKSVDLLARQSYHFYDAYGRKDYLASIFYLVNCLQEYGAEAIDKYARYPYTSSIQYKENILQKNIVQTLIDDFCTAHFTLATLPTQHRKSSIFLTHDIDTVYGAKNQNGSYALKNNRWWHIPRLLWNHYLGSPDWLNMEYIMAKEDEYGFKSVFYWLVYKDKANADYDLHSPLIKRQLATIKQKGFEVGLHKSIHDNLFIEELKELGEHVVGQRYHFLKFTLPHAWIAIEQAGLKLDTSLGFSDDFGFRNSYGLPFMPYNIAEKCVFDFIEVPMQIMDRTFFNQQKSIAHIERDLIEWLDNNKWDTIIAINFHNNFFDQMLYAGYDRVYETILRYCREEGIKSMLQADLIEEYYRPDLYKSLYSI